MNVLNEREILLIQGGSTARVLENVALALGGATWAQITLPMAGLVTAPIAAVGVVGVVEGALAAGAVGTGLAIYGVGVYYLADTVFDATGIKQGMQNLGAYTVS